MNLQGLKIPALRQRTQVVVFDRSGAYEDSCNSLADFSRFREASLYEAIPFLEGMRDLLSGLLPGSEPIVLPTVELQMQGLSGFFDMFFMAHPEQPSLRVWVLLDQTAVYQRLQRIQQERNQLLAERQVSYPDA
jgi:hypothetical protein